MTVAVPGAFSTPALAYSLRAVTEAAARAAYDWIGRGDRAQGDGAAIAAAQGAFNRMPVSGTIVVGEGADGVCIGLCTGERVGAGGPEVDVAVDPVEGTSYLVAGLTNAMAVVALAPRGTLFDPGPAFYMEKFAGPPAVRGKIDPAAPLEDKLATVARETGKPIRDLTVFVLEKPRHRDIVARIHKAGARVALYPAGDVAGALAAAIPGSGIDALIGTGGSPEAVLSACAIRLLGGEFLARLDPQLATEKVAVKQAGLDCRSWLGLDQLVRSDEIAFCATGITSGLLIEGVERGREHEKTQTLMIAGPLGERQLLSTWHRRTDLDL